MPDVKIVKSKYLLCFVTYFNITIPIISIRYYYQQCLFPLLLQLATPRKWSCSSKPSWMVVIGVDFPGRFLQKYEFFIYLIGWKILWFIWQGVILSVGSGFFRSINTCFADFLNQINRRIIIRILKCTLTPVYAATGQYPKLIAQERSSALPTIPI